MELAYDELYGLTPRSFNNKLKGAQSIKEELLREGWEQTRTLMIATLMPHSKKKLKAEDVLPLPWDSLRVPKKKDIASKEHIESVLKKYNKANFDKI